MTEEDIIRHGIEGLTKSKTAQEVVLDTPPPSSVLLSDISEMRAQAIISYVIQRDILDSSKLLRDLFPDQLKF